MKQLFAEILVIFVSFKVDEVNFKWYSVYLMVNSTLGMVFFLFKLPDLAIGDWEISKMWQTSEMIWAKLRFKKENIRTLNVQPLSGFNARNFGRVPAEVEDPEVTMYGRGFEDVRNACGKTDPDKDEELK